MFDKRTRIAIEQNTNTFGDGFAGRGARPERNDPHAAPARRKRGAGAAQPRLAADRLRPAVRRARQNRQRGRAGGRDAGGLLPASSTPSSPPSPAPRPRWNGRSKGARRRCARRSTRCPTRSRHRKGHRVRAPAAAEREDPDAQVAAPLGHAFEVGTVNVRAAARVNEAAGERAAGVRALRQEPVVRARPRRTHPHRATRHAAVGRSRARTDQLQLHHARVPQRRQLAIRERRQRHARCASCRSSRLRGKQRGAASLSARQRGLG